jgi:hypothetical protein
MWIVNRKVTDEEQANFKAKRRTSHSLLPVETRIGGFVTGNH